MIPLTKPDMDEKEADAARRVILSGWVAMGPETAAFENEFAHVVGSPFACAVASGTAALHLALLACDVGPGDEVITVSSSFIAVANSIRACGGVPVFVDIDPKTFNINPSLIEGAISPRTKAILCVHQIGMPCDLRAIIDIARRHDLRVIEDAACAVGSSINYDGRWEKIGKPHGDIACFSLHARKIISTGEGGVLTTRNPEFDRLFRLWRHHGMTVSPYERHASSQVVFEHYEIPGFNYRLNDIQAAIGRVQLERLPEILARRRTLRSEYEKLLRDIPGLTLPVEPDWAQSNWQSYCVAIAAELDQKEIMQKLLQLGIATRRGIMCAHREAAYPTDTWHAGSSLDHSEHVQNHSILIPFYPQMTAGEQHTVAAALHKVIRYEKTFCF